jgi:hypothetical protein
MWNLTVSKSSPRTPPELLRLDKHHVFGELESTGERAAVTSFRALSQHSPFHPDIWSKYIELKLHVKIK